MYTLHDYARMIADEARMRPYVRALEAVVRPGSVVLDVGTGTGILALVACRLGARRVFAIDTNSAIEVGRELARENGFSDRIVFLQKDVREVELPERADVIVSDLRGMLPLCEDHLAIIADIRSRLLKPGGILVPASDRLIVAVVEQADLHDWAIGPARGPAGVTLEALRFRLRQTACRDRDKLPLKPENVLSTAVAWATIDYNIVESVPLAGRADLRIKRAGIGHGLALWFDAVLADTHSFSTAPGNELCYGRCFLPWPRPVALSSGDAVAVELWSQPAGEPWGWNSSLSGPSTEPVAFKQSSFLSLTSNPTEQPRHGPMSVPLSPVGNAFAIPILHFEEGSR